MHVTFHLETPNVIPQEICPEALEAAQDFVNMCCQHAAFMAGRGGIPDEIMQLQAGSTTVWLYSLHYSKPAHVTLP